MEQTLQKSIVETLCYFSQFEYPLTREELFTYLWRAPAASYDDYSQALERGVEGVEQHEGFYHLRGEEALVGKRAVASQVSEQKLERGMGAARLIRWVPFLRAVFVCNTVAAKVATPESDIDVFIIAQKNHLWTVRFLSNIILFLCGLRRHGSKITDRICLSFYVDTDHLSLDPLKLAGDDIYLAYWLVQLVPLYDPALYKNTLLETNAWTHALLPNARKPLGFPLDMSPQWIKKYLEFLLARVFGSWLERGLKKMQLKKIHRSSEGKKRDLPTAVVVTDGVLKFHETDRRELFRERWLAKCATFV